MIKLIENQLNTNLLYRVKTGETIESICAKFNTTRHQIIKDNPYNIEIHAGSLLYISNCNKKIYIVQPTDSINKIAQKLGKTESEIRKIVNGEVVFIGQILEFD